MHPQTVEQAGVKNYVVVAIDAALRDHLAQRGVNVYFKDVQAGRSFGVLGLIADCLREGAGSCAP